MAEQNQDILWERWDEVDRLFGEALDVALEDRPTFLKEACGDDPELFDTVSRLLDSSDRASDILPGPGTQLLRAAFGHPERPEKEMAAGIGQVIGRYRILRELGRGGMATVYEAERADGAYQQRVALKILRGVDSEDVARRFVAERQILSSLSHPNIGQLLECLG
jgi:serine/threonine-protein kinase